MFCRPRRCTRLMQDQVKVSRAQFEGTARPVLTFEMDFDSGPRTPATLPLINFRLRNVGVGPAFNVQIQDTIYDDFKARWDPIDIIRQQTTQPVSFYVTDVNTGEFQPGPRTIGCLARLLMGRNFSPEHPAAVLKVYYEDLSRQHTQPKLNYDTNTNRRILSSNIVALLSATRK